MPARVLLISVNTYDQPCPVFPLGLACVDAALRRAGHTTCWLDLLTDQAGLADTVRRFAPTCTGISLRNIDDVLIRQRATFYDGLPDLCQQVRTLTTRPVVLGGSGFSIFPAELLELSGADYGIQGEGEVSLVKLVTALEAGADPSAIPGLVFRRDGRIVINPPCPELCPGGADPAQWPESLVQFYLERSSMLCLQTQRGCPFRCGYCTYPLLEGSRVRRRPAEAVAEDMAVLQRRGARYLFIVDSVFNSSHDHVASVCETILRRNLALSWAAFLRPQGLTADLMRLMARAGLKHIEFGSDSFSDPVLSALGKGLSFDDILHSSGLARQANVDYCHYLICGGPGETEATLDTTLANSRRLPGGVILAVVGVRLYPGTAVAALAQPGDPQAARSLLEPRYYVSPALAEPFVFERLATFSHQAPNWIVGDPPPTYLQLAEKLRRRGVTGPLWSYFATLQKIAPVLSVRNR